MNAAFVARMEDVLAVYERPHDPRAPVVCFDERPCVLHGQPVEPLPPVPARPAVGEQPAKAGRPRRESSTYVRQGTACLLAAFEPGTGQRLVEVSARRTGADYGRFLQRLAAHYPQAEKIGLVQDNGNTHADAVFYQHLPVAQARALAARFEGHYTPKNASWLNMVELELRPSPASACTNASPPWKNSPPTWPLAWPSGMRPAPRSTGNSPWKKLAPNSTATTRRLRQLTPLTEH